MTKKTEVVADKDRIMVGTGPPKTLAAAMLPLNPLSAVGKVPDVKERPQYHRDLS